MANEQHIDWLLEGVEAWNARLLQDDFTPDLADADLAEAILADANLDKANLAGANLVGANFVGANLDKANLAGANLAGANLVGANLVGANLDKANLAGANLVGTILVAANLNEVNLAGANLVSTILVAANLDEANLAGANLVGAILVAANLNEANLTDANLTDANLTDANLTDANLTDANLTDANLTDANLTDANLTRATFTNAAFNEAARSTIKDSVRIAVNITKPIESIGILRSEIDNIENNILNQGQPMRLYFRGEPCVYESLTPSVARKDGLVKHESEMIHALMSRHPEEFSDRLPSLAQWSIAQHHGMRTRLLDITRNSLTSLFFACEDCKDDKKPSVYADDQGQVDASLDGRVHVFAVPETLIKQYDSDSVSIISNFFKLRSEDQRAILDKTEGTKDSARNRLIQLIRAEKPYFDDRIDENDLSRVFIVEPQQSFQRIKAQESAYIVSARHLRFEPEYVNPSDSTPKVDIYRHYTLIVPEKRKPGLLKTLSNWGFTRERLFPGLESSAQVVNQEYADRARTGEVYQE